jgi:hypothetical protein
MTMKMITPLNQRPNDIFLSHSSRDKIGFVDGMYEWLTKQAGLRVWYDRNLESGQISSNIDSAIDSCRSAVIVISTNSSQSPWVEQECSRIQEEANTRCRGFRIATIRLDETDPPGLLKSFKHIDVTDGHFSPGAAALLMETLFGGKQSAAGRPVYLSRGWKNAEQPVAERIIGALQRFGIEAICDCTDQPHYDDTRILRIMCGTGGLAAILPHRGDGKTSSYIVKEFRRAREMGLPVLVFAEQGVAIPLEWALPNPVEFDSGILKLPSDEVGEMFGTRIEEFVQLWKKPARGEHIFLGHSLEESIGDNFQMAGRLLSRITGLAVKVGGLVAGADAQNEIIQLIQDAELCVIDISNVEYKDLPDKIDFAFNSCIEAGIALGCSKDLYLTCRGPRRSPPFMFRNKQVWFYDNELELVGHLRRIAAIYRRLIL